VGTTTDAAWLPGVVAGVVAGVVWVVTTVEGAVVGVGWVVPTVVGVVAGEVVGVVVVVVWAHADSVTWSVRRVTAPVFTRIRPVTVTVFCNDAVAYAMTVPKNFDPVFNVADDPTCQKMLQAWTPPSSTIELPVPVISVVTAWKMKTELGVPVRVSVPVRARPLVEVYTPASNFIPLKFLPVTVFVAVAGAALASV